MTYWGFHATFILPAIGALLLVYHRASGPRPPRVILGFGFIAGVALFYTTPWDNYLIERGIWSYPLDRVSGSLRLGRVPLEECCFFVLQPVLTGSCLLCLLRLGSARGWLESPSRVWTPRIVGGALSLAVGAAGALATAAGGRWLYLGLILVWGVPPLALHWCYGGETLWQSRHMLGASLLAATIYLWAVDRAAIGLKIWSISPLHVTGWELFGLPVEEAVFFLVTNLLVLQGLMLFFRWIEVPGTKFTRLE